MKKSNINFFKVLSIFTSVLFVYLFFLLLLGSESFLKDLGLQSSVTTFFLAKRASIFMLGISVLMFGSRNLTHSKARQVICLATGITMLGLACMGTYELMMGNINSSIMPAIVIEVILGISFGAVVFQNNNAKVIPI